MSLREAAVVRMSRPRAQNGLLTSPSWSPSRIRPPKNESIQLLLLLPVREPQVLLGEDFLVQPANMLVLSDDETHIQ